MNDMLAYFVTYMEHKIELSNKGLNKIFITMMILIYDQIIYFVIPLSKFLCIVRYISWNKIFKYILNQSKQQQK